MGTTEMGKPEDHRELDLTAVKPVETKVPILADGATAPPLAHEADAADAHRSWASRRADGPAWADNVEPF